MCVVLATLLFLATAAKANTYTAASCNTSDVQSAINSAAEGDTVLIPAGTCTWTSGVTISGKGITIQGAGSGRIIAYDNGTETPTIGTGTQTFTIAGYSPGFSASSITNGETLRVFENNNQTNYMQGTVTSLVSGVLTMNITSTGGSGSTHRWLISTLPSTVLINNSTTAMFGITEDTSFHTSWSGMQVVPGSATPCDSSTAECAVIVPIYASGGQAILIHDCWMQINGAGDLIDSQTNRGVMWNCSANGSSGNPGQLVIGSIVRIKGAPATSWTTPSTWGAADTTGTGEMFLETNDFHALQSITDNDDNGRMVFRYNLVDNSQFSTHGADTSNYGERYFEYYNNTGVFNAYSDGSTFNLNGWLFIVRGGTFVMHDNTLPALSSQDYGSKADVAMTVMNLQRGGGPDPCWGAGFTTPGQYYHAPRQVGMGYVTGTGTANYPPDGVNNSSTDSITYVGDSEPVYIWNNSRSMNISLSDGSGCPTTPTLDSSSNYIVSGRDYFNGTAKPSYTPYTYPHPLTQGSGSTGSGSTVNPPTGLAATVQVQ